MTFLKRKIDVEFQLANAVFDQPDVVNAVRLTGLRVQANISHTDGPALGEAQVRIHGIAPGLLNQLSSLNESTEAMRKNRIIIYAGNDVPGETLPVIFAGTVKLSQIDLQSPPDSSLTIVAYAGAFESMQTTDVTSFPGGANAADIMRDFAVRMGLDFEGNNVSVILNTPYFSGSLRDQANSCAAQADIAWTIEQKTLAIWYRGVGRTGSIPVISPETGMIGYPGYSSGQFQGLLVTTEFNPLLRIAKPVKVESSLKVANGVWYVYNVAHSIESETPGGKWLSQFSGQPLNAN